MGKVRRAEQATSEMRPGMSSPDRANCLVLSLRECKRGEREPQAAKSDETPCARMKRTWNPFPSHPGESKEPISHLLGLLLLLHGTSNGQSLARLDLAQQMNRQVLLLSLFALAKECVPAIGESWQKSPAVPHRCGGCKLLSAHGSNHAQSLKFSCWTVAGIIHPSDTNSVIRITTFGAISVLFRQAPVR